MIHVLCDYCGSRNKPLFSIHLLFSQETEKKIKELQSACDEIKKEIMQRQMESKSFKEDLENNNRQIVLDKKEYEKLIDEMEKLKVSFFFCFLKIERIKST